MENNKNEIRLHPQFLEILFAHKSKVFSVFRDVLGLYEINHIALNHINHRGQLVTLSSTPAIEYNLFNNSLWQYDRSYDPAWFLQCSQASWQSLYNNLRYDELYYIKQIKSGYPVGYSLAAQINDSPLIFSVASKKSCQQTMDLFQSSHTDFYKIAQYCTNLLLPLLTQTKEEISEPLTTLEMNYESSK